MNEGRPEPGHRKDGCRLAEALLFASAEPLAEDFLQQRMPEGVAVGEVLAELVRAYDGRGVNLVRVGASWAFRTAPDLAGSLQREVDVPRRLSRAAVETIAIIAYHQPATRAEIEEIRGVVPGRGTMDMLLELGWIRPHGRRETPGRPLLWVTTEAFLDHFGLSSLDDLPGLEELRASGLLDPVPEFGSDPEPEDNGG